MQEEGAYLEGVVRENEVNLEITRSPGEIAFNRLAFSQLHHAIQRRFIRKVLAEIDPEYRQMNFEVIERGIASMLVPQSWAQMDWISDWKLTISPDRILIHQAENQSIFEQFPHVNDAHVRVSQNDGEVSLNGYWRIRLTSQNCTSELRETIQQNEDETLAYLDETLFRNGGIIRSTRRGDRFQPLGMDGTTKLSDFFINRKIPKQVRQSWPLLVIQDQIEWVVGLRVAETARVTETTERVLSCKLFKTRDNQDGA